MFNFACCQESEERGVGRVLLMSDKRQTKLLQGRGRVARL
jgi:hypothetical protein